MLPTTHPSVFTATVCTASVINLKKKEKKRRYSQVSRKEKQTINLLQHFAKTNWFADHMERVSKDKPASY